VSKLNEANYFYLQNGGVLSSLEDFADEIRKNIGGFNLENFNHHITSDRNDYANWINHVFHDKSLADKVASCSSAVDILKVLEYVLSEKKQKNNKDGKDKIAVKEKPEEKKESVKKNFDVKSDVIKSDKKSVKKVSVKKKSVKKVSVKKKSGVKSGVKSDKLVKNDSVKPMKSVEKKSVKVTVKPAKKIAKKTVKMISKKHAKSSSDSKTKSVKSKSKNSYLVPDNHKNVKVKKANEKIVEQILADTVDAGIIEPPLRPDEPKRVKKDISYSSEFELINDKLEACRELSTLGLIKEAMMLYNELRNQFMKMDLIASESNILKNKIKDLYFFIKEKA
jgi:hypothetical protein